MKELSNDIPKYKKKRDSSVSKSINKAKHKHCYKEVILVSTKQGRIPRKGICCEICGKIYNVIPFETDEISGRMLNEEEIYEKYKHLEKIYVDDFWQKYVPIGNEVIQK